MSISAQQVKELRERTGAGMMDCKKALAEVDGDLEAAVSYLREQGLAGANRKSGRVAADGLVGIFATDDGSGAVMLELNCETDFVAKTDEFKALLDKVGAALLEGDTPDEGSGDSVDEVQAGGVPLATVIKEAVASIGENISLRRFVKMHSDGGPIGRYVHAGGKIGVLVDVRGAAPDQAELTKSLAMQAAAALPRYVSRGEVPEDEIAKEREIFKAQALASGKPENVVDRIVDGKLEKFYREICLLEQEYVRDPDLTVEKLIAQAAKDSGRELAVQGFARYQLGEGVERKESNLAEEVAAQIAQG